MFLHQHPRLYFPALQTSSRCPSSNRWFSVLDAANIWAQIRLFLPSPNVYLTEASHCWNSVLYTRGASCPLFQVLYILRFQSLPRSLARFAKMTSLFHHSWKLYPLSLPVLLVVAEIPDIEQKRSSYFQHLLITYIKLFSFSNIQDLFLLGLMR